MISFDGITKTYAGRRVLDSVTFDVADGMITGFLGLNGAGKTTTLRILLGLTRAERGTAHINGRPIAAHRQPWREVGAVLDDRAAHPGTRGRDHLRVLSRLAGLPDSAVDECLDRVGLQSVASHRVRTYSLGMRQRLALAGAILAKPRFLVLDEPGNGLDAAGLRMLRDLLVEHSAAGGTVFLSSHRLGELEEIAHNVVALHRGKIVGTGAVDRLLPTRRVLIRTPEPRRCQKYLDQYDHAVEIDATGTLFTSGIEVEFLSRAFAQAGIPVYEVRNVRSSLDEYFIDTLHTGKAGEDRETIHLS